jgi:hypothetical protein
MRIIRTVKIENNSIIVDNQTVFQSHNDEETFLINAFKQLNIVYPKFYKMDTMSKIGFIAAEYILAKIELQHISPYKKGIVLQNISASLDTDRKYQESIKNIASPALFVYTLPNIVMGEIAIRNNFKGENTFFVVPKFNREALHDYANLLFQENILDFCIIGFIESDNLYFELLSSS